MKKKLAVITSHPIQYHAPLFELLAKRGIIDLHVFYTWGETVMNDHYDPGFGKEVYWDIPLLNGYSYEFLPNTAKHKGSHHFNGIINPTIIDTVENYKPDAILVFGWAFNSHLKVLRHFKNKVPIFFRGDSTLLGKKSFITSVKRKFFLRWVYGHVNKALYVGSNNYDYYKEYGLKDTQLVFAPHAIDNNRFSDTLNNFRQRAILIRETNGIKEKDLVFLFAGKIDKIKNPELLIKAFLKASFPEDVHLIFAGTGPLESLLNEKYNCKKNLHFIGFQNQQTIPSVYHACDVFVLPSGNDTWGLAVNEAMASSKAVLVSNKCGCAVDLVKKSVNGLIFESGNESELTKALIYFYNNRLVLSAMGKQSKLIIDNFSFERIAVAIENLFKTDCI